MAVLPNLGLRDGVIASHRQRLQRTYAEITTYTIVRAHQPHAGKLVQHGFADGFLVLHGGPFELYHQHVTLNFVSRRPNVVWKFTQIFR